MFYKSATAIAQNCEILSSLILVDLLTFSYILFTPYDMSSEYVSASSLHSSY